MTHRFAGDADVPQLARWNAALIRDERADNPMDEAALADRMRRFLAEDYRAVLFEQNGEGVAYALYRCDREGVYLRQFYVVPAQRRRGLGRRAVETLVDDVLPPDARVTVEVLVHNAAAHAFWRAVGFADHAVSLVRRVSSAL